jgi:hypothetical protein
MRTVLELIFQQKCGDMSSRLIDPSDCHTAHCWEESCGMACCWAETVLEKALMFTVGLVAEMWWLNCRIFSMREQECNAGARTDWYEKCRIRIHE